MLNVELLDRAEAAANTRETLIDAAIACDFELLVALAWADVPANPFGWGTFWGEPNLNVAKLRQLDVTQNALWDLAVALIGTVPIWEFSECEGGGGAWYCGLEWYEWPVTRGRGPWDFSADQLERLALLDGTTPEEFADRLRDGYSTFGVVISTEGQWMAAYSPSSGECESESDSATDLAGEPDWRRFFLWTDALGCLVRVDILYERVGPDHCDFEETRVLVTGDPLGARYTTTADSIEYVRDPNGAYGVVALTDGFAELDSPPADAIDTGFRLRDRELWISPGDPDAIYLNDSQGAERWPRGAVPPCA